VCEQERGYVGPGVRRDVAVCVGGDGSLGEGVR
jgi:hypothetical protein